MLNSPKSYEEIIGIIYGELKTSSKVTYVVFALDPSIIIMTEAKNVKKRSANALKLKFQKITLCKIHT